MSSKAKRTADGIQRPEVYKGPTKTAIYRIDFEMATDRDVTPCMKSAIVEVAGIPKSISHKDYGMLAQHTAQTTFCNVLNSRTFLETYPQGKTPKDGILPDFINLYSTVSRVSIKEVVWLEEKE